VLGGKRNIIGLLIHAVDYKTAVDRIVQAAHESQPTAISALAVHGLMTGVLDSEHKYRLNHLGLLVPDGQPIRWALKSPSWGTASRSSIRTQPDACRCSRAQEYFSTGALRTYSVS